MKFLLTSMLICCSTIAFAQNSAEPSLFPELDVLKTNNTSEQKKEVLKETKDPLLDENPPREKEAVTENLEEIIPPSELSTKEESSENSGEKDQNIVVFLDDIDITLTPNRNGSFCSAKFGVMNQTKKTLKGFSGSLMINQIKKDFKFSNLKSMGAKGETYVFIGHDCEQLMDPAELEIQTCQIDGWSEEKCEESIVFFATSNSENNIQ